MLQLILNWLCHLASLAASEINIVSFIMVMNLKTTGINLRKSLTAKLLVVALTFSYASPSAGLDLDSILNGNLSRIRNLIRSFGGYSTEKPKKIKHPDGSDALLLQLKSGRTRTLYTVTNSGKLISKKKFTLVNKLFLGDFIAESGNEIALRKTDLTSYTIFNPFSKKSYDITLPLNTPITSVNVNDLIGNINPQPTAPSNPTPGNLPPANGACIEKKPNDGNEGYLWKPNSDTQHWAVTLFPPAYTGSISRVEVTTASDQVIEVLKSKGVGNGNRSHWISAKHTGSSLRNAYGSIKVRGIFDNGGCLVYFIQDPSRRVD